MNKPQKKHTIYLIIFIEIVLICLWGGIYDFTYALYGIIILVGLCYLSWEKPIVIPVNITTIGMFIMLLGYLISTFLARDKGVALFGVIRNIMLIEFWIFWNNISELTRKKMLAIIPDIATILTVMTVILYFVPSMREYLFQADRMGGVFQYSNTYALFLLISIVILFYRNNQINRNRDMLYKYIEICVLICGIVFCGSRSVMILTVITVCAILLYDNSDRKLWILILGISIVACLVLQFILKLDIQRLLKLTLNSSTLNGRFLYWKDAISVILKNPLGLGYMGYYFLQPQFQTGCYVTKFVHNDILQCALDAGIVSAVALVVIIIANICNKDNTKLNRIILVLLFLHCLFDFDLQFSAIFCILLMCMGDLKNKQFEWKGIAARVASGTVAVIFIYFSIALSLAHFNQNDAALSIYPGNTFAREDRMWKKETGEDAEIIIEKNGMIASVYEFAARQHLENAEYMEAYRDIQGMLITVGYQIDYYNQAVFELSIALDQALSNNDNKNAQYILEEIQGIPELLEKLKEKTSDLAYRINDKPTFELREEIREYIESLEGVSLM